MVWYKEFGGTELVLIAAFLVFYALFFLRLFRISKLFPIHYPTVIVKFFIRTILFTLLIVAFLGPSIGDMKREVKAVGKDIMMCVDLSKSMDAFDIQPTRLEKVKFELKRIVESFNSDRIGIIIFSSEAFMQCPLTFDQNALNIFIESMNTTLVPSSGTDFEPPMRLALNKLDNPEESSTQQKSKIIILISDGEDFGDDTDDIADDIENKEIKVFTLGVGTESGGMINDSNGMKLDKNGNTVVSKLDVPSLKKLAGKTNGQYFEISDSRNDVSRLINTISKIEGETRDARIVDVSANRYFYFLLGAVLLLVFDLLISFKTVEI